MPGTCVWQSLLQGLKGDLKKLGITPNKKNRAGLINTFVHKLKQNNQRVSNITVNNVELVDQQINENFEAIKEIKNINNGYLCSTCDPMLILVCKLFNCNIKHKYLSNMIHYENPDATFEIELKSSLGHMAFVRRRNCKDKETKKGEKRDDN